MNEHIKIFVIVIALITLVGVVVSFLRKSSIIKGYEEYAGDISRITSALKAELFRDGDDIVITGNHKQHPVQVRLSYAENTPGLSIRMQAPVSFTYSVVPKGERATEGRLLIRTGDDMFDLKFATRTDHPTQAKMVITSKSMTANIVKLCCSSKTFLTLTRGTIEQAELTIPSSTTRHVLDHLEQMSALAKLVAEIPGAETVKVVPYQREKSTPVFRLALAAGAICALIAVFVIEPTKASPDVSAGNSSLNIAPGVPAFDARAIGDLRGLRAAAEDDFDGPVRATFKGSVSDLSGRVRIDLDSDEREDVAYWLVNANGPSHLVLLKNGKRLYDTAYPNVAGIARVPASETANIDWQQKPNSNPTGDGVLLVTRSDQGYTAVVLYASTSRVDFGVPVRWERVPVR
jgi:hypothetical protein